MGEVSRPQGSAEPGSPDPKELEAEVRRLLVVWQRSSGTKWTLYEPRTRAINRLLEIAKTYDYDLGPTPSTGLAPRKWEDWYRSALPPDPRCPCCVALGRSYRR